jgi:hypothetical protein
MISADKKKTVILVALLAVAGLSWYYVYRPTTGPASNPANKAVSKAKAPKVGLDAQIRLDLIGKSTSGDVGRKNLFQYYQRPAPKPPEPVRPVMQTQVFQTPTTPSTPVAPPPPPFKAFRYEGFSVAKNSTKILGSITEGGNTYSVWEGECVMGQYCITRLTENLVEIEDLLLKRRQTFTRVQ